MRYIPPSLSLQFYDLVLSQLLQIQPQPRQVATGSSRVVDRPEFLSYNPYYIDLIVLDLIEQGLLKGYQSQN
jgi:hypothetical protein